MSQPISRVPSACAVAIIPLALGSLLGSSTQPAFDPDQIIESLFELAPGGVYHAFPIARKAVSSYLAISPLPQSGGLLSVALVMGLRPPGVTWHLVLRSSDFPPPVTVCLKILNTRARQRLPGRLTCIIHEKGRLFKT